MPVNYDLASEGGMKVFGDGGEDPTGVAQVKSTTATIPALAITGDFVATPVGGASSAGTVQLRSVGAGVPALLVSRSVVGASTIGTLRVAHNSVASGAVLGFGGGFISVTSILGIGVTGAAIAFDYLLPVELNGVVRGIPLTSLISIPGAAAF